MSHMSAGRREAAGQEPIHTRAQTTKRKQVSPRRVVYVPRRCEVDEPEHY